MSVSVGDVCSMLPSTAPVRIPDIGDDCGSTEKKPPILSKRGL